MTYYYDVRQTSAEIRALLRRLDSEPADALESETLECKSWDAGRDFKSQAKDLQVSVVCLANARGGAIVLGIRDRATTRAEAIAGVGDLEPERLRKAIFDGTDPHLTVEIEELREPEGRVLIVYVPRGVTIHSTSEGISKIRIGKECKPLTGTLLARAALGRGGLDFTSETVPGATLGDLDPEALKLLRDSLERGEESRDLLKLSTEELLAGVDLVRDGEISLAAILLVGRPAAIARWAGQHEVIFLKYATATRYDVRHDLRGPVLMVLEAVRRYLEPHVKMSLLQADGLAEISAPDITWWVAREAILNALVHRDYFLRQSIYVELRPGRLEVSSPGGFTGGVNPENVLRHRPVRRNPLLAEALQRLGYVNRAGMGVDRIYEDLLRLGKAMPRYEADEAHVRLVLPLKSHAAFARFVDFERRAGRPLDLDDMIVLRTVSDRGEVDRWTVARGLQREEDEAAEKLVELRERGYLIPRGRGRGTAYCLSRVFSDALRGARETDDTLPLDDEAVGLRVQAVLAERGTLTNADVRRLSGYSRAESLRLLESLRESGRAVLKGRGRGAHYEPGPKLPAPASGRRRR